MSRLYVVVLCLFAAARLPAQCCGDCNGDGTVAINELIRSVNAALDPSCPSPPPPATRTPTPANACPYTFNTLTLTNGCGFTGRYNSSCGLSLPATINGDNGLVAVEFGTTRPAIAIVAEVTSATTANLLWWATDPFTDQKPLNGTMEFSEGRRGLVIHPDAAPFQYDGCAFEFFAGIYTRQIVTAPLSNESELAPASVTVSRTPRRNFTRTRPGDGTR